MKKLLDLCKEYDLYISINYDSTLDGYRFDFEKSIHYHGYFKYTNTILRVEMENTDLWIDVICDSITKQFSKFMNDKPRSHNLRMLK